MKLKWTINDTKSAGWILLVAYSHALRRARPLTSPHAQRLAQWSSEDGTQIVGLWWLRALIHRLINSRQTIFLLFFLANASHLHFLRGDLFRDSNRLNLISKRGDYVRLVCCALRAESCLRGTRRGDNPNSRCSNHPPRITQFFFFFYPFSLLPQQCWNRSPSFLHPSFPVPPLMFPGARGSDILLVCFNQSYPLVFFFLLTAVDLQQRRFSLALSNR